ncbi:MAG: hypothetical protein BYD32DRAFT_415218 [Podila humilis]|nr:MAG: hypothetical protein BYD32DRAFT_415218 [Podila humilis]
MAIQSRDSSSQGKHHPPTVLIVGGGLAGLLLAILLEHIDWPYQIFERAEAVRPFGSTMAMSPNILAAIEQIGIYEDLLKASVRGVGMTLYNEQLKKIFSTGLSTIKELLGYDYLVFPRPVLYDLLLAKVPKEKLAFKKKVLAIEQTDDGVTIHCSDKTSYEGHILVGADGAYSAVRQCLYKDLAQKNKLPASDATQMNVNFTTMVGTTDPLDPNIFPGLGGDSATQSFVYGKNSSYTWCTFTVAENRICWHIMKQLDSRAADEESFRNSEWMSEANDAMIHDAYDFKTPHGTIGSLIEQTPKDLMSKVFLEDKLFETWYNGRVVLIGDACHKMLPGAGQGAVNALQDAVILANCLYDLESYDTKSIAEAFKDYHEQRCMHVQSQYETSKLNTKITFGQTLSQRILRFVVFKFLPKSFFDKELIKEGAYRPQVTFLPRIPNRGRGHVLPQKPSKRHTKDQATPAVAV